MVFELTLYEASEDTLLPVTSNKHEPCIGVAFRVGKTYVLSAAVTLYDYITVIAFEDPKDQSKSVQEKWSRVTLFTKKNPRFTDENDASWTASTGPDKFTLTSVCNDLSALQAKTSDIHVCSGNCFRFLARDMPHSYRRPMSFMDMSAYLRDHHPEEWKQIRDERVANDAQGKDTGDDVREGSTLKKQLPKSVDNIQQQVLTIDSDGDVEGGMQSDANLDGKLGGLKEPVRTQNKKHAVGVRTGHDKKAAATLMSASKVSSSRLKQRQLGGSRTEGGSDNDDEEGKEAAAEPELAKGRTAAAVEDADEEEEDEEEEDEEEEDEEEESPKHNRVIPKRQQESDDRRKTEITRPGRSMPPKQASPSGGPVSEKGASQKKSAGKGGKQQHMFKFMQQPKRLAGGQLEKTSNKKNKTVSAAANARDVAAAAAAAVGSTFTVYDYAAVISENLRAFANTGNGKASASARMAFSGKVLSEISRVIKSFDTDKNY